MTKRKFTEKVLTMERPILEEGSCDGDLLSCYLFIYDENDYLNKMETEAVRLTRREYLNGPLDGYYKREKKLKLKYEKWLFDICGNHYTSKLKIA